MNDNLNHDDNLSKSKETMKEITIKKNMMNVRIETIRFNISLLIRGK